ncbi:MAG: hypothetical protein EOP88_01235 [Verrucomicrobiaceae bacterium]|nr:MAG: hypothetical protein EOP88_01235 [Verrucomicrobiaceae bacterium]
MAVHPLGQGGPGSCSGPAKWVLLVWLLGLLQISSAFPVALVARAGNGSPADRVAAQVAGKSTKVWNSEGASGSLICKPSGSIRVPDSGVLYLQVAYVDRGYGRMNIQLADKSGKSIEPDRYLGLTRGDTGGLVSARMRFTGIEPKGEGDFSVRISLERSADPAFAVESVTLQDTPFEDPFFKFVLTSPWEGGHKGSNVRPADNTTLKGKVMTGYQGWFRTPNDPYGSGTWSHWGNIQGGTFAVDMWPDISQYPPQVLEKAADVKLRSGKQAYLFSSAWPQVVNTHFRWMRENNIDGAFLQRFVNDNFNSISGRPEWVLSNVRAAANREGRIWAIEYDVSGYPDDKLLETLKTDWKWFVDKFRLLDDPNYAREGGKPVVFIWGMPFPNRNFKPETANAVVDFFRNDPQYGGNYVIGGIPNHWREMDPAWQEHFKKYECVLAWMSARYEEDITDFKKLGLSYYSHVMPGFSWANLKHLPTGDTAEYTPRAQGEFYWDQLTKAAQAGSDRMFVGMFDEYDEATAIMPMSDDAPPTPVRPGVAATFYRGTNAAEHGNLVHLPAAEVDLSTLPPGSRVPADHFFVRMGGSIVVPANGVYSFSVEGAQGDDAELNVNGKNVLRAKGSDGIAMSHTPVSARAGDLLSYRLEYRHRTGGGKLRLLWEKAGKDRQPVPPEALKDAWGRFLDNEGRPSDWWMKLTDKGRQMMNGKLRPGGRLPGT